MVCRRQGGRNLCLISLAPPVADVARSILPDQGRIGLRDGHHDVGHCARFLVVHRNEFGCVHGRGKRLRNHHGDRLAYEANLLVRQKRAGCLNGVRPVTLIEPERPGTLFDTIGQQISASQNSNDTRRFDGRANVHGNNARARVGRANKGDMQRAFVGDVIGVTALARNQAVIFSSAAACHLGVLA